MKLNYTFQRSESVRTYGYWSGDYYHRNRRPSDRPDGHSIVYPSFEGEGWLDNLENRRKRPHQVLRPYVIEALTEAGVRFKSIRWSQTAGCLCPCSPGWIIQKGDTGTDYWIRFSAIEVAITEGVLTND